MFKEECTNNIYDSWLAVTRKGMMVEEWKGLEEFSIEELFHMRWLMEQQIAVLRSNIV